MMVHIHRLTVLMLTHVRRSRGPRVSRIEPRSGDAVAHPRERGERTGSARLGTPFGLGTTLDAPPWLPGHLMLGARPLV